MADTGLRVASWPGRGAVHNAFMSIFLDGLEQAGCETISVERAEDMGRQPADIMLIHWAERVFGESQSKLQIMRKVYALSRALSRRGPDTKAVWLVHNTYPHDARRVQRLVWPPFTRMLATKVDGWMTLSPGTLAQVSEAFPGLAPKPSVGLWHPVYPDSHLAEDRRVALRNKYGFGPEHRVFGYCGQIRPYKGVEDLLEMFSRTHGGHLRLFIAGRPGRGDIGARLQAAAAGDPRVVLDLRDLPAQAFVDALNVPDIVVAPMRQYLHSGSILHALSAGRQVLTPSTPFAEALAGHLGKTWVQTYPGSLNEDTLMQGAGQAVQDVPDLSAFSANRVGQMAVDFFKRL